MHIDNANFAMLPLLPMQVPWLRIYTQHSVYGLPIIPCLRQQNACMHNKTLLLRFYKNQALGKLHVTRDNEKFKRSAETFLHCKVERTRAASGWWVTLSERLGKCERRRGTIKHTHIIICCAYSSWSLKNTSCSLIWGA